MRTLLGYLAVFDDEDTVYRLYAREPVGYHQRCLALHQFVESLLYEMFVLGVGKGCRLVEYHDGSILEDGTCQCDTLLFATGEVGTFGSDFCLQPVGQTVDNLTALRELYGTVDSFCRGIGATVGDILPQCGLEQFRILKHERDTTHQLLFVNLPNVYTSDTDAALVNVPETRYQAGDGGLASARSSDECIRLTLGDRERYAVDGVLHCPVVTEHDTVEVDTVSLRQLWLCRRLELRIIGQLLDTRNSLVCQEHILIEEHNLHNIRRYQRSYQNVEKHIGDDGGVVARPADNQYGGRYEEVSKPIDDNRVERIGFLPAERVFGYQIAVGDDTVVKAFEREYSLLEHLYDGYSPHVFHRLAAHTLLCVEVLFLEVVHTRIHQIAHRSEGCHERYEAGYAQPPVEDEEQHHNGKRRQYTAYQVGHNMSNE